ncbi:transcriptional repressor LexA [Candidatus Sumerlaeota bacterium]|nr:transcriptional repressor LexA [Candidatus Sumerlaeota bacterium]
MPLTRRQRQILDFISSFISEQGYSPSLEEIGEGLGLSSLATIHKHLKNLERKGMIRRQWNHSRSIQLVDPAQAALMEQAIDLPLLGRVAAGQPIEAIRDERTFSVPQSMVTLGRQTYVLEVEGDSMIEEHIADGDYIVVESRETAMPGETVVALVEGENVTVKKYFPEGELIRLQPANAQLAPIMVQADQVQIQGVVVGLMRRYR